MAPSPDELPEQPSGDDSPENDQSHEAKKQLHPAASALLAAGRATAHAGAAGARKVSEWYRAVDPDVSRHLFHLPLLAFTLLSPRRAPIEAIEPDGYPPLIMVHGLGGGRGDFLGLSYYLRMKGRLRSYRIGFEKGHDIREMAEALLDFVAEVTRITGEPKVDIVAHSLGGLVVRFALCEGGLAPAVRTAITLGTPHGGTHAARVAGTPLTRDLRPDSEFIQSLAAHPWPKAVRGLSLWSRNDLFIIPSESAALEGTEAVDMTPFTHYSYLVDPRCWTMVRRALEA